MSTDPYLYILNENNGATIYKTSISSLTKPLISNEYLFLITKDNLLVCIDLRNGKVQYSLDISEEIAKFLQTKNKSINIKSFSLINDKIFIFLKNSFVVHFHKNGKINKISKLPSKISSLPIFINEKILFLNKKNKLILVN